MSKFKGYEIVKKVVPKELCEHISDYFLQKRKVTDMLFNSRYQSPFDEINGIFSDKQAPGCFSIYSDINNEVLLTRLRPTMERVIGKKLIEAYSYCRVYERGAVLDKHKDRPECEYSTTLNLGGDPWPIFINNTQVILKQGDMLVYEGCKYEHWRERFDGVYCTQVFLHYVEEDNSNLKYDGRPMLGLPAFFKGRR